MLCVGNRKTKRNADVKNLVDETQHQTYPVDETVIKSCGAVIKFKNRNGINKIFIYKYWVKLIPELIKIK